MVVTDFGAREEGEKLKEEPSQSECWSVADKQ